MASRSNPYGELNEDGEGERASLALSESIIQRVWSLATFSYLNPLIDLGFSRPLLFSDLPKLDKDDLASSVSRRLSSAWDSERNSKKPVLMHALLNTFGRDFVVGNLYKVPQDLIKFVGPIVLRLLVQFIDPIVTPDDSVSWWSGLQLVIILFVAQLLQSLFLHQYFHRVYRVAMQTRSGLICMVYEKALVLNNMARQDENYSTGAVVNMMQVCERVRLRVPPLVVNRVDCVKRHLPCKCVRTSAQA